MTLGICTLLLTLVLSDLGLLSALLVALSFSYITILAHTEPSVIPHLHTAVQAEDPIFIYQFGALCLSLVTIALAARALKFMSLPRYVLKEEHSSSLQVIAMSIILYVLISVGAYNELFAMNSSDSLTTQLKSILSPILHIIAGVCLIFAILKSAEAIGSGLLPKISMTLLARTTVSTSLYFMLSITLMFLIFVWLLLSAQSLPFSKFLGQI